MSSLQLQQMEPQAIEFSHKKEEVLGVSMSNEKGGFLVSISTPHTHAFAIMAAGRMKSV